MTSEEESAWVEITAKDVLKLGDLIRIQNPMYGIVQGPVIKEADPAFCVELRVDLIIPGPNGKQVSHKIGDSFRFLPMGHQRFVPEIPRIPQPKFLAQDRGDSSRVMVELRCYQELDREARVARSQGRPLDAFVLECERDNYSQRRR